MEWTPVPIVRKNVYYCIDLLFLNVRIMSSAYVEPDRSEHECPMAQISASSADRQTLITASG